MSVVTTSRRDGDARPSGLAGAAKGDALLQSLVSLPWTFVRQVHGARVVEVDGPSGVLEAADAIVTSSPATVLGVLGADCALVGLASPERVIGVAHAGWRGLVAGVVGATAETMRRRGASRIEAVVSACVHAECYPFAAADLAELAAVLGEEVVGAAADGSPACDLPAALRRVLAAADVTLVAAEGACTACSEEYFSFRRRRDTARHLLGVWLERQE